MPSRRRKPGPPTKHPHPEPSPHAVLREARITQSSSLSGPLPRPDLLEAYDRVIPGAAERIMAMAEAQSRHRRELESKVVNSNIANEKLGQWLAFVLAILFLGAATWLGFDGHGALAGVMVGGTLVSLVSTFVLVVRMRGRDLRSKSPGPPRT